MKASYINHMGDDLAVVNAARVSFGKQSDWDWKNVDGDYEERVLSKSDQSLIQFLARGCTSGDWEELLIEVEDKGFTASYHGDKFSREDLKNLVNHIRRMPPHWSPFAHTAISLHLKMPIFVARQIMKHTTGMVYNEVSRRYVDSEPEFFIPDVWRKRADNVKQGSSDEEMTHITWDCGSYEVGDESQELVKDHYQDCLGLYQAMLNCGCSPEQARMVLPQSMYTEVIATGNLYSWANLFVQRTDSHAQKETQELAGQIGQIIGPIFPVSWEALTC